LQHLRFFISIDRAKFREVRNILVSADCFGANMLVGAAKLMKHYLFYSNYQVLR